METDNQNSWDNLRSGLDGLGEVPGEVPFDTNAAWNKLHARLQKKPIHHKAAFYWIAAAVFLCVFSTALYLLRQPDHTNISRSSLKYPALNSNPIPESKPGTVIEATATGKTEPQRSFAIQTSKIKPTIPKKSVTVANNNNLKVSIELPVQLEDSVELAISPVPDTLAVVRQKPVKLKVIHNNQLNSVIYKPELSVTNAPTRSGQFRFSRNASDNILQVKLSLTN